MIAPLRGELRCGMARRHLDVGGGAKRASDNPRRPRLAGRIRRNRGQILAEWARVGRTHVVNAERMTGGPLTLQLTVSRKNRRSMSCFGPSTGT